MYPALFQSVLRRSALVALPGGRRDHRPRRRRTGRSGAARRETDVPRKPTCRRAGRRKATTWPGAFRSAAGRRRWRSATAFTSIRPRPATRRTTQERLVAIDAETGKVVWERRFSLYLSDVPQHRASWASPAVDPETGNIYLFTVAAQLVCVSPDGKVLWDRSLHRRVRRRHHARRPHHLADHRGRQGHSQRADPGVGRSQSARQPLLRVRQEDRADDLDQLAAVAPLRHQLLDADRRAPSTARARWWSAAPTACITR